MLIQLKNLSKAYGKGENKFLALKNIDLEIKQGEFVAIMGPSGSGKSTLMNILGALSQPTSGKYLLKGEEVNKLSEAKLAKFRNREVGFVFQQFNLLPKTTVLENVLLPSYYGTVKNPKAQAVKVIKKVGLGDKLGNKSNQLSGGQIQRVAIARALMMNPAIIMADEPTGNLDTKKTKEILKIISNIHSEGNTVIMVTHERYIANYSERIINLLDGKIKSDRKVRRRTKP